MTPTDPERAKLIAFADSIIALDRERSEAIETLRWIYHGHTDNVQYVRDVAKRRLEALGAKL